MYGSPTAVCSSPLCSTRPAAGGARAVVQGLLVGGGTERRFGDALAASPGRGRRPARPRPARSRRAPSDRRAGDAARPGAGPAREAARARSHRIRRVPTGRVSWTARWRTGSCSSLVGSAARALRPALVLLDARRLRPGDDDLVRRLRADPVAARNAILAVRAPGGDGPVRVRRGRRRPRRGRQRGPILAARHGPIRRATAARRLTSVTLRSWAGTRETGPPRTPADLRLAVRGLRARTAARRIAVAAARARLEVLRRRAALLCAPRGRLQSERGP